MFRAIFAGCVASLCVSLAQASEFPAKQMYMVLGSPGSSLDVLGREIGQEIGKDWNTVVVTDYKSGLSGLLAADAVKKAPADGSRIFHGIAGTIVASHTLKHAPINPARDLQPIALTAVTGLVVVANKDFPANSIQELIEMEKKNPGSISYGTYGAGSVAHLYGEIFNRTTGTQLVHVPYNGESASLVDVVGGSIPVVIATPAGSEPLIREGKIKALVATGASRNPILPDVPTLEELGYKGMHMYGWYGMFVHKDTPPDRVEKLSAKVNEILAKPSLQEKFRPMGLEIKPLSLEAFREMVARDDAMWEKIAKSVPLE